MLPQEKALQLFEMVVTVKEITADSPAELSGLRPLDQVLEINGTTIGPSTEHTDAINMVKAAVLTGSVRLVVGRTVIDRSPCRFPGTPALQLPTAPLEIHLRKFDGKLGFTIRTIDGENPRVALVVPGSPAAWSDLQVGQMIMAINGKDVAGLGHDKCMKMLSSSPSDYVVVTVVPDAVYGDYLRRLAGLHSKLDEKPLRRSLWWFDPIRHWKSHTKLRIVLRYLVLLVSRQRQCCNAGLSYSLCPASHRVPSQFVATGTCRSSLDLAGLGCVRPRGRQHGCRR